MLPLNHFEDFSTVKENCILTGSHVFLPSTVGSPFIHLGGAHRTCRGQGGKAWSLLPPAQPSGYCWASHTVSFLEPQFSHRYNGNDAQAYLLHLLLSGVSTEMEEVKMTQPMGLFLSSSWTVTQWSPEKVGRHFCVCLHTSVYSSTPSKWRVHLPHQNKWANW